jgi:hypothetical protein
MLFIFAIPHEPKERGFGSSKEGKLQHLHAEVNETPVPRFFYQLLLALE